MGRSALLIGEGCLDIALGKAIIKRTKWSLVDYIIAGGGLEPIKQAISLVDQISTSITPIVFIDSDNRILEKIDNIKENFKNIEERYYYDKIIGLVIKKGSSKILVLFWHDYSDTTYDECGRIECLLHNAMVKTLFCGSDPVSDALFSSFNCYKCPSNKVKSQKIYRKLTIISVLAACAGYGTLASLPEYYGGHSTSLLNPLCGLPAYKIINGLDNIFRYNDIKKYIEFLSSWND
ncbi:MAG: hypothetical protein F7C35_08045 [Desulfurococcales archaeon]|nr:hypothetical protein [Desulfurococcales archaeon]